MIQHDRAQTAMAREIREIPLTTERLLAEHDLVAAVAHRIREANPRVVVISGRGSSGNAGTFLRYLFETRVGLLVSTSAPSVVTTYRRSIDMRNAVFIVISQSGRSPDLVTGARSARKSGAPKSQKNKGLRQCDSSKMTVANQLSQAACDSATVPYYIGTACTDRRTAAPGTGKGKSNRTSTGRQLSIHNGATRAARGIEVPHWFVSAGWL